ncbi:NeuD/PglB/VioB family sugar acetyltransferase [Citrobacter amalonaticus]|uniref:NeuD/PglB/VioB family sugar acetyltransferase n=1 Tax=Citrobacter amalonaticus TaxID=35703 RepID=UPI001902F6DD|nr:NeuD/PglB/VioB family sugar acetyltransferase [Citrobacter amalonaticus]MBJ9275172.1 NeuD/PglB/VioB family sugar acetyltransferase [Citrobacter amalonaticus]HAU5068273.1 acetyltransferase [Citrobacter amalonaticus]
MYNKIYGIFGASGFGREVLPLVRPLLERDDAIYFIDTESQLEPVNGVNVISYSDFLNIESGIKFATIAIANADIRQKIESELLRDKVTILNVVADNVIIMDDVKLGDGAILCPFVTLTSNINIGRSFHANIYSYVAHDCIIGDYVTFAPSVKCNGNIVIEDHVYIGTGAMIKQGTQDKPIVIGEGAVIGMGAVVTKSVKAGDVVFGCPAKSIKRGA